MDIVKFKNMEQNMDLIDYETDKLTESFNFQHHSNDDIEIIRRI